MTIAARTDSGRFAKIGARTIAVARIRRGRDERGELGPVAGRLAGRRLAEAGIDRRTHRTGRSRRSTRRARSAPGPGRCRSRGGPRTSAPAPIDSARARKTIPNAPVSRNTMSPNGIRGRLGSGMPVGDLADDGDALARAGRAGSTATIPTTSAMRAPGMRGAMRLRTRMPTSEPMPERRRVAG